jgi:hypothetical protein
MLDLTGMSEQQKQNLFHLFEATAQNPLEMMKLHFLSQALVFKTWVEKNATVNKKEMNIQWSGFESAVSRFFTDTQREIALKCGLRFLE